MDAYKLSFPECVSTPLRRGFAVQLVSERRTPLALTVEQRGIASESDMSRLLGVLSKQRRLSKITFKRMTFPGFRAQLLLAFMSRYASVAVEFDACAFVDYQSYRTSMRQPCSSVKFANCNIHPDHHRDFIATVSPGASFTTTRADCCLSAAYLLSASTPA